MLFLSGVLVTAGFFVATFSAYKLGQMNAPKYGAPQPEEDEDFELEEQREKVKRQRKAFDEMMSYNETKAVKG